MELYTFRHVAYTSTLMLCIILTQQSIEMSVGLSGNIKYRYRTIISVKMVNISLADVMI